MDWEAFYKNYRKPDYIPGYEIINKLGGGVFGVVFKARKQSIGKFYAVKFLKVEDSDVKAAVLRELEGLRFFAQIDHPNLVSIEDKGEVDGIPFIVMGYAGDETLKRRLESRPLDPDEALRIFRQVCEGVQALHEKSIVHFDLKPGNVFLKSGIARVGDYGLSRLMSESRNTLSFGRGTPYYMAPEMLRNKGDKRSDVYSLGVMLFECLTGDVPFRGDSEWEVLKKHEVEPVCFPKRVPAALRPVLQKCLAKRPEDRYDSVRELIRDLPGVAAPVFASSSVPAAAFASAAGVGAGADTAAWRATNENGDATGSRGVAVGGASVRGAGAGGNGRGAGAGAGRYRSRGGRFEASPPGRRGLRPLGALMSPVLGTVALLFERILFGLRQADDAVEAIADPSSREKRTKLRRPLVPVPDVYRHFAESGLICGVFRIAGLAVETAILLTFVPVKFCFVVLGRVLDGLVHLPFKLLGVAVKLVVVVAGFYALFLFVRFVLPFSLGILFRFH